MEVNKIQDDKNLCFKKLYVAKDLSGLQKYAANSVSTKLHKKNLKGIPYIQEIKDMGYDVLIIKTEFNDPESVRLCIIKDMEKYKAPDGTYDYLDAKVICETDKHFSSENFLETVRYKTTPKLNGFKSFISRLFH